MKLVIVESPTKAKTISRYLPRDFVVESSYGHIRDLPAYELGVDIEKNFQPKYVVSKKNQPTVKKLKELARKSENIILATDEDREGEAIAWHIMHALGLENPKSQSASRRTNSKSKTPSVERIAFHEITKRAIAEALKNPKEINHNRVEAQQTRRILDRLVGYKLSPFLWKKLVRGLSAGRVQSVALRLTVEREEEIRKFKPETFWTIEVEFQKAGCPTWTKSNSDQVNDPGCRTFRAVLEKIDQKTIAKPGLKDKKEVNAIVSLLKESQFAVQNIENSRRKRLPNPPFTTSTLQQDAFGRLGYSAKKTMMVAQQLYETGFITYMRTDSLNVSSEALSEAREYLSKNFGQKYHLPEVRYFKNKSKLAQEAHEAIRPTSPKLDHEEAIKKIRDKSQQKLYRLIWQRFMASQMKEAIFEETRIYIADKSKNTYELRASGAVLVFDGFLRVYPAKTEDIFLPALKKSDELAALKIENIERQTKGPARFSDATLVKELEKSGIGRPSTYAPIISTIEERGYIVRDEQKRLRPTEMGEKVNAILVEHFSNIVDINFTRNMEDDLDAISEGKKESKTVLKEFYDPFAENLSKKYETVEKEDLSQPLDRVCEKCGKNLVIRQGRFGRFIACSGFPECKYTEALPPPTIDMKCPLCRDGDVVIRRTRRKRIFYGCSKWPDCDFATWQKPTGHTCPECGSVMVEAGKRERCSNKSCQFRSGIKKDR